MRGKGNKIIPKCKKMQEIFTISLAFFMKRYGVCNFFSGNYGSGVTVGAPRHFRRGRTGDIYEGESEEDEDDEEVW